MNTSKVCHKFGGRLGEVRKAKNEQKYRRTMVVEEMKVREGERRRKDKKEGNKKGRN